jgi:preprotein translocase subunit SecF
VASLRDLAYVYAVGGALVLMSVYLGVKFDKKYPRIIK